jgi:hypothetical protein
LTRKLRLVSVFSCVSRYENVSVYITSSSLKKTCFGEGFFYRTVSLKIKYNGTQAHGRANGLKIHASLFDPEYQAKMPGW